MFVEEIAVKKMGLYLTSHLKRKGEASMAYYYIDFTGEEHGPHSCHIGEYCGNEHKDQIPFLSYGYEEIGAQKESNTRKGIPHSCPYGTSQEMQEMGFYGLYLTKEDSELLKEEHKNRRVRFVPTPAKLMEPGKEHLHNLNGKFGLVEEKA